MKSGIFQLPKKIPEFNLEASVFRVDNPPASKTYDAAVQRLYQTGETLGFRSDNFSRTEKFIYLQDRSRVLRTYFASDSFSFFDLEFASPSDISWAKKRLPFDIAKEKSRLLLSYQKLLRGPESPGPYRTLFQDAGYTVVKSANVDFGDPTQDKTSAFQSSNLPTVDESPEYQTDIRMYRRFQLNGLPVFGSGAKIIVAYVDDHLSEEHYLWRNPKHKEHSRSALITPQDALNRLLKDKNFLRLGKLKSNDLLSGRLHENIELGYYALPPAQKQRFYLPVYAINGTIETRTVGVNSSSRPGKSVNDSFRHDFTSYVLALPTLNYRYGIADYQKLILH